MNAYRENEGSYTHSSPKYQLKAHGQLYAHGEVTLMPTTLDAGWASETVFILWSRKNPLTLLRIKS